HKDETVSEPKDNERSTGTEPEVFAKLFGHGDLTLFADLGGGQVFEQSLLTRHLRKPRVGISYQIETWGPDGGADLTGDNGRFRGRRSSPIVLEIKGQREQSTLRRQNPVAQSPRLSSVENSRRSGELPI